MSCLLTNPILLAWLHDEGMTQYNRPYKPSVSHLACRLLSLYHNLHGNVHAKNAHLKVHYFVSRGSVSLAWVTPIFEMYCVAGPHTGRNALAQSANKIIQWVRREEERVFIIGGAVSSLSVPLRLQLDDWSYGILQVSRCFNNIALAINRIFLAILQAERDFRTCKCFYWIKILVSLQRLQGFRLRSDCCWRSHEDM